MSYQVTAFKKENKLNGICPRRFKISELTYSQARSLIKTAKESGYIIETFEIIKEKVIFT